MATTRRSDLHASSDLELLAAIRAGIDPDLVYDLVAEEPLVTAEDVYHVVIPRRTLSHRRQKGQRLTRAESDKLTRLIRILHLARETFQDDAKARRWLHKESRVLKHCPVDILDTEQGARLVERELGRIAHGVYV